MNSLCTVLEIIYYQVTECALGSLETYFHTFFLNHKDAMHGLLSDK